MIKTNKLKGRMKELGITQKLAADVLDIDPATFNKKLNGRDGSVFTVTEANEFANLLKLSALEKSEYFFNDKLAYKQED
ncbi:MAG TPA: hypothetical protein VJY12_04060 [Dysgonamonadaceae bacterium]|nr:hypothetical protein [Dysgonamonadaceae bacterium]